MQSAYRVFAGRERLLLLDGIVGALTLAGAALNAEVSIDLVVISTLNNSLVGAGIGARAARHALVGDNVPKYLPPF